MDITNAQYTKDYETNENLSISCIIDGKEANVPLVVGNRHYDEILRQVSEGIITIQPAAAQLSPEAPGDE